MKNNLRKVRKFLADVGYVRLLVGGVLILGAVVFYLFFHEPKRWVEVEVKVLNERSVWARERPAYWLADVLEEGSVEYDGLGRDVVRVKDVRVFERVKDVNYDSITQGKDILLRLEVKARLNKRKSQYVFKGKSLSTGSVIELDFSDVHLSALVMYMPDDFEKVKRESKIVMVITTDHNTIGIPLWLAEKIEAGDKMTDGRGRVLAEVLEKKVEKAKMVTVTNYGVPRLSQNPLNKQVYLKLKIDTVRVGGVNYFMGDLPVKVSRGIPLYMDEYVLLTEIIEIIE